MVLSFPVVIPHRIHVWYIYLHLAKFYGFHVGKYASPMDPMGTTKPTWSAGLALRNLVDEITLPRLAKLPAKAEGSISDSHGMTWIPT